MSDISVYDFRPVNFDTGPDARERLIKNGASTLSDADLVTIVLGTGIRGKPVGELAGEVLDCLDSAAGQPDAGRLKKISGIGGAKACAVAAALELGRRLYGFRDKRISSPRDAWPLIVHWADRKQERFICGSLNGAHEVIALRVVSVGLVNRAIVHPREVFADPIMDRASAVIVAHNHPSGRLEPSPEDIDITRRLKEAADVLGISLLDHLIFSENGYFSFLEHELLAAGAEAAV